MLRDGIRCASGDAFMGWEQYFRVCCMNLYRLGVPEESAENSRVIPNGTYDTYVTVLAQFEVRLKRGVTKYQKALKELV